MLGTDSLPYRWRRMSFADASSDHEAELAKPNPVSLRSIGGMSNRSGDDGRVRPPSGPRGATPQDVKHQNDAYWREQIHTLVKSDSESEVSDTEHFLTKGAFLLTPSYDLTMEKASTICEKMNFKGCFSLTKTATGILFKFSSFEDYQAVYKKGFHKVTNSRFYRKVIIPCRPQKTFTIYVFDIPDDLPEEDIRHSLYKFSSIVEVVRMQISNAPNANSGAPGGKTVAGQKSSERRTSLPSAEDGREPAAPTAPTLVVRITLASIEECNILLQNGLDFYGATFFPTELAMPQQAAKMVKPNRVFGGTISARVRDLLPVFDNSGFAKFPPPAMKMIKPKGK